MRILIVNRFMPPDEAPTSVLAGELAEHLRDSGHDVECIAGSTDYRGGNRGVSRIVGELASHLVLLAKMMTARKPDLLLCLSSPTCLAVTAALATRLRRVRFGHWAMDVYPEVAARLGEIKDGGIVHRITARLMLWAYRSADVLVALDEDMQELFKEKGLKAAICRPWTPLQLEWPSVDEVKGVDRPLRWVYSGNLGRAHEWEQLLEAQKLLETESPGQFELVFQGSGANRQPAQAHADQLNLRNCHWNGYAPKAALLESLFDADVLIATQNPATKGLLWPSKLAVMRHVPRPILWIGPDQSAVSDELDSRPHTATFSTGSDSPRLIADWLKNLRDQDKRHSSPGPKYAPPKAENLRQPIADLEDILIS